MDNPIKEIVTQTISNIPVDITENESMLFNSLPEFAVISALKEIFHQTHDDSIQSRAFDAILKIKTYNPVEFLIEIFDKSSFEWKIVCCHRLAFQKDSRAIVKLCDILLNDDNPDIRFTAAESLGEIGDLSIIHLLKHAQLNDMGVDYEGFRVSDMAKDAINKILSRNVQ